jgi:hypothetical protein
MIATRASALAADELETASRFDRVKARPSEIGARHQQFDYQTRSKITYRVWCGYDRNRPWRTAAVSLGLEGPSKGLEVFNHHAGHESLEKALEWLQALD